MRTSDSTRAAAGIVAIAALGWLALPATIATAASETLCEPAEFEGAGYTVCRTDPKVLAPRLFWRNGDGKPYRSFSALADDLAQQGNTLLFAMNAGMYDADFKPIGLYVENGEQLVRPNTADVQKKPVPNFYKKPNGVFYLTDDGAAIAPTDDYIAAAPRPRFATQSGPLLVIEGELHPAFIPGSTDKTRRSGVGVCAGGEVKLAISEGGVNFDEFARLFRDSLGCHDALFLDGGRGVGIYEPTMGRNDFSWHGGFGPMLAVVGAAQ